MPQGSHSAYENPGLLGKSLLLSGRKGRCPSAERWQLQNERGNQASVIAIAADHGAEGIKETLTCNYTVSILGPGLDPETSKM